MKNCQDYINQVTEAFTFEGELTEEIEEQKKQDILQYVYGMIVKDQAEGYVESFIQKRDIIEQYVSRCYGRRF